MQTAVYWIEYAARNPDLTFRTRAADVPFYQHMYLDVAFVFLVFGTIVFLLLKVKTSFREKTSQKKQSNRNKKKQ